MDYLEQYIIPFGGLKPGEHPFNFEIDKKFFDRFEYSQVRNGHVFADLVLDKQETMLVFSFSLHGEVEVPCDRCNEPLTLQIKGNEELIVKFGADYHEEDELVQIIPEGTKRFDVSPFLYEYIHLLIPARRVHPDDGEGNPTCNPEILNRMESQEGSAETDPRWDVLKKLKPKN
jgi:uncharacterized metal-binding protein YceD (DUF177 family)